MSYIKVIHIRNDGWEKGDPARDRPHVEQVEEALNYYHEQGYEVLSIKHAAASSGNYKATVDSTVYSTLIVLKQK